MERQELIDRIKKLPHDRIAEVAEFVESLAQTFCCVAIAGRRRSQQEQCCTCHQVTTLDRAKLTQ